MGYSKDDIRYWQQSGLFKETFKTGVAQRQEAREWSARMMHEGKRQAFPLDTPNRDNAASKAREIYRHLVANGWEQTLAKYKPGNVLSTQHSGIKTVGDFIEALQRAADIKPKTLEGYAASFRTIVASISGISSNGGGGSRESCQDWRLKVHAVKLLKITPTRVAEWKRAFLAKYPADHLSQRRARISVNSIIKSAKCLYAPKYLKHLPAVPESPFQGIELEKRQSQKYRSSFNVFSLIEDARKELEKEDPELYKIFLLASMAGLRRAEIDLLEWSAFKWEQGIIRIEPTQFFHPKSEDSIGDIPVDPEFLEVFREFKTLTLNNFVITSPFHVQPKPDALYRYYRCNSLFVRMVKWLQQKGVQGANPLHTLRKEFGSQLADKHGIYVASRMLRHSDIQVTAAHYLDKKSRKTVGLGSLLKVETKERSLPEQQKIVEGSF